MPFIHPAIFWTGLGAVSLPIIIHLLNRRRFKVLDWAAMKFLLESIRKNRRRLRIEELILLMIRCLVILMLALVVSRFTGCGAIDALPTGGGSSTVVFVVDDSYSMAQKLGAGTLFSAAMDDLSEQLEKVPRTHKVAILLTSRPGREDAFFALNPVTDRQMLINRLATLRPSDQRTSLADAMETARKIFADDDVKDDAKRLFLLSDYRRVDLAAKAQSDRLGRAFTALKGQGAEVIVMDYGREAKTNLTILDLRLLGRFAVAGAPIRIGLTVHNNGDSPVENVQVKLSARLKAGGKPTDVSLPDRTIESIDPGQSQRLEFTVTSEEPGSAFVRVELPSDELAPDNVAQISIDVRKALKVLIVDGNVDVADPEQSESYAFRVAIDPHRNGDFGNVPEVISADAIGEVRFADYDTVVLMNVPAFPPTFNKAGQVEYPQLAALEQYVRAGGGLAIFTGDKIDRDFYNRSLYAKGAGLSPLLIRRRKGDPTQIRKYYTLDPKSFGSERFLKGFAGEAAAFAKLIRFTVFHATERRAPERVVADVKAARVLARFTDEDNSPAIVSRQFGRGLVVMFYTTASKRWNDWPMETDIGTYVSVMQGLMSYLARPQAPGFTERVGEPIVHELTGALRDAQGVLRMPDYPKSDDRAPGFRFDVLARRIRRLRLDSPEAIEESLRVAGRACVVQDAAGFRASLAKIAELLGKVGDATEIGEVRDKIEAELVGGWKKLLRREFRVVPRIAGVYTLRLKSPEGTAEQIFFCRNTDPIEGDLAPAGRAAVTAALGSEKDFVYVHRAVEAAGVTQAPPRKEYWMWALLAMLTLLALETFLAQRFGHYS